MGGGFYSDSNRSVRATTFGYTTGTVNDIFTQQKERVIFKDMDPKNVKVREARDSENHPNTIPVQLYLDVTGSMGKIPHMFIRDGLPTMITKIIQAGVPDVALMFGAIGDHECDVYPLQIGQFESGDEELDHWLTHTYIEGGGGGNRGESYALAWYFANNHVSTDAWDKRGQKGIIFTIGDEPILPKYPARSLESIMGENVAVTQSTTSTELFTEAMKKNYVYHIHIEHGYASQNATPELKMLLGENLIVTTDYNNIPNIIAEKVVQIVNNNYVSPSNAKPKMKDTFKMDEEEIIL